MRDVSSRWNGALRPAPSAPCRHADAEWLLHAPLSCKSLGGIARLVQCGTVVRMPDLLETSLFSQQ
jgi:hypothetical protein